ncbi:hypothetical protein JXA88_03715 [Candidatus Fermentibacteria bacterium]|nr:hypothetical protein [Candidatus Fermentibacteria bacterium]
MGRSRAVVTSGPTRARLDAVRFLMNTSSGSLGAAIADQGLARGWEVGLVHGPCSTLPPPHPNLSTHPVSWLSDLYPTLLGVPYREEIAVVFHAMAVLDWAPRTVSQGKRASGRPWRVVLDPTPKIIDELRGLFPNAALIAFKLETGVTEEELVARAGRLARRCGADIVVANLLEWVQAGYRCRVVCGDGSVRADIVGREETAAWLWGWVENRRMSLPVRENGPRKAGDRYP